MLFAIVFATLACLIISPLVIALLKRLKANQSILGYVEEHKGKNGTPTMGGIIFIIGALATFLMFINTKYTLATICLLALVGFGLLGFVDDLLKVKLHHNEGLKPWQKMLGQFVISLGLALAIYFNPNIGGQIIIPFVNITVDIGWGIIPFIILVFIATTNSVNLTDGLDGLAGSVSAVFITCITIVISLYYSDNMSSDYVTNLQSVSVLSCGLVGGILAYLVYNQNPAKVFMGDVGSLALGGYIACICCVSKFYLLLPIVGIMFVLSSVSDIIQVLHYKRTKKRIFLMAPLHHHFQMKGYSETKIVYCYTLVTILISCVVIGLYL